MKRLVKKILKRRAMCGQMGGFMNSYRSIQNETTDVKEGNQNLSVEDLKRDVNVNNENLPEVVGSDSIKNLDSNIESNLTGTVEENTEDLTSDLIGNVEEVIGSDVTKDMEENAPDQIGDINTSDENIDGLIGMENTEDMMIDNGFVFDDLGQGSTVDASVKDPLLSNLGFTIGVTAGVFAFSVVIGILLAKKRIKKGIDLYEN